MDDAYVTDPTHGGKVTCHKCCRFIRQGDDWFEHMPHNPGVYFHCECFNRYEHYYGLDRPID